MPGLWNAVKRIPRSGGRADMQQPLIWRLRFDSATALSQIQLTKSQKNSHPREIVAKAEPRSLRIQRSQSIVNTFPQFYFPLLLAVDNLNILKTNFKSEKKRSAERWKIWLFGARKSKYCASIFRLILD